MSSDLPAASNSSIPNQVSSRSLPTPAALDTNIPLWLPVAVLGFLAILSPFFDYVHGYGQGGTGWQSIDPLHNYDKNGGTPIFIFLGGLFTLALAVVLARQVASKRVIEDKVLGASLLLPGVVIAFSSYICARDLRRLFDEQTGVSIALGKGLIFAFCSGIGLVCLGALFMTSNQFKWRIFKRPANSPTP